MHRAFLLSGKRREGYRSMYIILIAAAVIPAIWLLIKVYKADRLEQESPKMLISLVVLGVLSTSLAGAAEELGDKILSPLSDASPFLYRLLLYFAVVGLAEEGFKYLLLKIRTWKSPEFNCTFDGVVYSVFVSLGFALWENVAYVLIYGFGVAMARAVTAVPGHACFGVFMGAWYGVAKRYELAGMAEEAKRARRTGLWTAVLLHGAYDFIASLENDLMGIVFLVFIGWMFRRALSIVRQLSAEDTFIH